MLLAVGVPRPLDRFLRLLDGVLLRARGTHPDLGTREHKSSVRSHVC